MRFLTASLIVLAGLAGMPAAAAEGDFNRTECTDLQSNTDGHIVGNDCGEDVVLYYRHDSCGGAGDDDAYYCSMKLPKGRSAVFGIGRLSIFALTLDYEYDRESSTADSIRVRRIGAAEAPPPAAEAPASASPPGASQGGVVASTEVPLPNPPLARDCVYVAIHPREGSETQVSFTNLCARGIDLYYDNSMCDGGYVSCHKPMPHDWPVLFPLRNFPKYEACWDDENLIDLGGGTFDCDL